jgi:hypothetical protein
MGADMTRTTEAQLVAVTLFAVADMGGKLHLSPKEAKRFEGYSPHVVAAIVTDMHEAWGASAYAIRHALNGVGLIRYCNGSGQSDVSPLFETKREMAAAMRTVSEMCRYKK